MTRLIFLLMAMFVASTASAAPAPAGAGAILIFSGTTSYRHASLPAGVNALAVVRYWLYPLAPPRLPPAPGRSSSSPARLVTGMSPSLRASTR